MNLKHKPRKFYLISHRKLKKIIQGGGALAKPRKPNGVDKAGYIMSMFLAGPNPSFATAGFKLGGQVYKGIKDNV